MSGVKSWNGEKLMIASSIWFSVRLYIPLLNRSKYYTLLVSSWRACDLKVYDEIYKVDHYENVGHKGEERTQLCLICATTLVVHAKLMPIDVLFYNSIDDWTHIIWLIPILFFNFI